jgi:hypothetical protein
MTDWLVDERGGHAEHLNLIKYATIISRREAQEPPDGI